MTKLDIINLKGEKTSDLKLNDSVWNIEANDIVLKKALDLQMASLRQGTHKTKTRSEVSGGGRKPYRQKGTGNARQGTIRAPHYRGGGVVFGVTPRDYTFKMNKKERELAIRSALTYKVKDKEMVVVDNLELTSLKTKDVKELIQTLKLAGKVLFVTMNDAEKLYLATRNLGYAACIMANEINVYDIVNADTLVIEEAAVKYIEEVLK
jgi:large subunit ribosomal protein L4